MKSVFNIMFLVPALLFVLTFSSCTQEKTGSGSGESGKAVTRGLSLYASKCQNCHGEAGQGGICPNLADSEWKYGDSDEAIYASIAGGRPGGMPSWSNTLSEENIRDIITYIRSLHK